eukprot:scaffold455012_cov36-Prasinocladus_malaysianus.AAC.1
MSAVFLSWTKLRFQWKVVSHLLTVRAMQCLYNSASLMRLFVHSFIGLWLDDWYMSWLPADLPLLCLSDGSLSSGSRKKRKNKPKKKDPHDSLDKMVGEYTKKLFGAPATSDGTGANTSRRSNLQRWFE